MSDMQRSHYRQVMDMSLRQHRESILAIGLDHEQQGRDEQQHADACRALLSKQHLIMTGWAFQLSPAER